VQIVVDQISDQGREVELSTAHTWALNAASLAMGSTPSIVQGRLAITEGRSVVTVMAAFRTEAVVPCARCGEDTGLVLLIDDAVTYRPQDPCAPTGEIELSEDDLDVGWYTEGVLNLDEVLTELVSLAMPVRVVCDDPLVCSARVQALQHHSGDEGAIVGHPAFAALKDIH